MSLPNTLGDFFSRYGTAFALSGGGTVYGCLSLVDGEDQPKELTSLPMGYCPAHRVRILSQGSVPLQENQVLTAGGKQYTLVLVRPVKLGEELLYYKSIAYEQEES